MKKTRKKTTLYSAWAKALVRKVQRLRISAKKTGLFLLAALGLWVGNYYGQQTRALLLSIGEKAALFSAAAAVPEGGLYFLREHYREELDNQQNQPSFQPLPPASESVPSQAQDFPQSLPEEREADDLWISPDTSRSSSPQVQKKDNRKIAPENQGTILEQHYTRDSSSFYLEYGEGVIRNSTTLTNSQAQKVLETPFSLEIEDLQEPQVLIYHTHATEAYEPFDSQVFDKTYNWRSLDNTKNMVAVGKHLAQTLEEQGIGVVHVETQHDNPSYNGAYDKSAQTIAEYLKKYPSIQVILDVHRDAIQKDADTIVKAVTEVEGKKAAQLMIIAGCDNDGSVGMPRWKENFRFSAALQDQLERMYPGVTRPLFFCYRKYNMDLCPNGALLEFGSHGNTLEEALYTAELVGNALAELLKEQREDG